MANKPAPSRLADQYQTYPTADAAATAALRGISDQKSEYGGGVLYNKAQNVYAATEPTGQGGNAHFEASVGVPQGWQLHSTYHTHPAGEPRSTQFSPNDVSTAQQLKAPSYVLARADDKIRMFDPASSKVLKDDSNSQLKYSLGSVVDETPPKAADTPAPASAGVPAPSLPPPPVAAATPSPAPAQPAPTAPAATVPVTGSRITMDDFANRHRAQTTKYKHKIVHIKTGAPKRP
jgi:hypothetical protein